MLPPFPPKQKCLWQISSARGSQLRTTLHSPNSPYAPPHHQYTCSKLHHNQLPFLVQQHTLPLGQKIIIEMPTRRSKETTLEITCPQHEGSLFSPPVCYRIPGCYKYFLRDRSLASCLHWHQPTALPNLWPLLSSLGNISSNFVCWSGFYSLFCLICLGLEYILKGVQKSTEAS